ncbi:MAG: thiamine pyrophosphate-binding protein [Deltaproteobacteria bacterium]|jgi:acetolactate synthase-1/2/3 large subunit|nr:thiamine pyrophosphate-binding protein [Deltaproteobacteria bacterium]
MAKVDGGELVARVLRENKVKYCFTINGGHLFPILANLKSHGVKMIHVRHEQAAAYAADAYARMSGEPGVCMVTAGCGLTNAVTGLCLAALTGSAVVCISGQHPNTEDHTGSFQEAYGSEVVRSFAKHTKRVTDWTTISFDMRSAFREVIAPPQGVALVEIPQNILYHRDDDGRQTPGATRLTLEDVRAQGNPAMVDRALEILHAAERPLIAGGDGLFWSQAAPELKEFVELTGIPVYTRRAGQGALPENHPLAVRGAFKKPFTGRADAVLALGFRFWSGEHFGQPPTWNDKARYIQVDPVPTRIGWQVGAEVPIVGDPKLVLRQMIARAKELRLDFSRKRDSQWAREINEARTTFERLIREQEEKAHGNRPIHPARMVKDLVSVLDANCTVIIDSFSLSGWMSQWFSSRFPGQIIDAGPLAPVGHGFGMSLGVQLARPGAQVVMVMGDGGLGIGGFDMETAARYNLPVVCVLWNNSSWGPSFESMPILKGKTDPFDMLPNIRYDKVFAEMGCHTEHVEAPDEIIPALKRAFNSAKPSLVNIVGDKTVGHPTLGGNLLGSTGAR